MRRVGVVSLGFIASLFLHALLILPFTRGGSARSTFGPNAEGAGAYLDESNLESVMTVVLLDDRPKANIPDQPPPKLQSEDLEPERVAIAFAEPELKSMLNLPGESLDEGETTAPSIPPTEVSARVPYGERGDRVGEIVTPAVVTQTCRNAYPVELRQSEHDVQVSLRVFVQPDGRIAQGEVAVSSGNSAFDRLVFQCVQTYANVNPLVVNSAPVGTWQTVTTHW